ncbi:protein odr-4 homolog isoform X2 [Oscarella lobularis]|uniref:protein odr-4 homolog isoform X2 n=1 Tax=Oscarella lobularis TaxID=121494 RepID=UPI0033131DC8
MGRSVLLEDQAQKRIHSLIEKGTWEFGLLIGHLTARRDYVACLIPTPQDENESDGGKIAVDDKWAIEHAKQVMRMLPGGLTVVGVYVVAAPDAARAFQAQLRQLVFNTCRACDRAYELKVGCEMTEEKISDRIVLQICSSTRKNTCRTLDISDQKSTARPAELKIQSFLSKWHRLFCSFYVDNQSIALEKDVLKGNVGALYGNLRQRLESLSNSLFLFDGERKSSDDLIEKSGHHKGKGTEKKEHEVNFFLPQTFTETSFKSVEASFLVHLQGSIHGCAYVHNKATIGEAVQALREDLTRSLLARCQLLVEDVRDGGTRLAGGRHGFPRRIFAPLCQGFLSACDYAFRDESDKF